MIAGLLLIEVVLLLVLLPPVYTAIKKSLYVFIKGVKHSVCFGTEQMSNCLERKIILMLKPLSSNYYTAMNIAITRLCGDRPDYSTVASEVKAST